MELSEHSHSQITYDKCKYRVKFWENEFKKQKGRLPSKLDIREASRDVRYAYKTYYKLKTALLEESLSHIDVFDNLTDEEREAVPTPTAEEVVTNNENINCKDTWGTHLNNSNTLSHKTDTVETPTINKSFSQKLFKSSKSSKLRKSLSFVRQKSGDDNKPCFLSQPESSNTSLLISQNSSVVVESKCDDEFQNSNIFKYNGGYILSKREVPKSFMQPVNVIQSALSGNLNKSIQSVNAEWLERAAKNIMQDVNNSTNVTSSHEQNDEKVECDSDDVVEESDTEQDSCSIYHIAKKQKVDDCSVTKEHDVGDASQSLITVNLQVQRNDFSNIFTKIDEPCNTSNTLPVQSDISKGYKKSNSICDKLGTNDDCNNRSITRNTGKNLKDRNLEQNVASGDNNSSVNRSTSKNLKEKKLQQKIASGTLNDNYVQINIKKKKYVRGKNFKSFSSYKKKQWKNKKNALYGPDMDMGGCDGGMLTCFNCGETGHFARKCKKSKSDALLPLQENQEEDCPHPTLEEAEKMARESVLAIRKSSRTLTADADRLVNSATVNDPSHPEISSQHDGYFSDNDEADLLAATELLEKKIVQEKVQEYINSTTHVKSYYELNNEKLLDTPQEVFDALKLFGHTSFRMGQETAIMRILSGQSTLVTLSTGSGKSLCYQLPAYLYSKREPCISLIISPLVSLMEDQVTGIPPFIKAACLHTNQTKTQREKVMEAISMGNLSILLVSPEAVVAGDRSTAFGSLLNKLPPIAFACIDEAHCVSQWSHNFRPSYLKICHVLRERLGVTTILGLTATATRATSDSIISHICIPDGRSGIISDTPLPDNLRLTVSRDVHRDQALLGLLLTERFTNFKSIIVYCTRREECERVASFLRTSLKHEAVANIQKNKKRKRIAVHAEPYHAGLSASRRKTIQKTFMNGELRIVVATVAFGMGINKSDIESVIHYNMPMSFESYVQEVGRAGRNGLSAHCHLFLDSQGRDQNELRRHIYSNCVDRRAIRKLLQLCFVRCSCKTSCPRHEIAFSIEETIQALDVAEENIETLLCYLELHEKKYIKLLSHAYMNCKIISYDGPNLIKKAAKDCPPLAMALALFKNPKDENIFEFPVVKVASVMGWDSGICKSKLKNLEWITVNGQPQRSRLNVEFLNLGFRILAPGNLPDGELDEALDNLYSRVKDQEQTALLQLHNIYTTLTSVAVPSFKMCISEEATPENEKQLKSAIREYFERDKPLTSVLEPAPQSVDRDRIKCDVRTVIAMYRDNSFTGRAIARIFHGIQSPNYPAFIWGRCKFWRAHLGTDFHTICQIAAQEIIQMR